jgi:hypothetical protein
MGEPKSAQVSTTAADTPHLLFSFIVITTPNVTEQKRVLNNLITEITETRRQERFLRTVANGFDGCFRHIFLHLLCAINRIRGIHGQSQLLVNTAAKEF